MKKPLRLLVALLAALLIATAGAQGGFTVGVGLNPLDLVLDANVTVPLFRTGAAQHAARGDVTYAFDGLPGVSATYLLQDAIADTAQTYVGAGFGVAFVGTPSTGPMLTLHALAGASVPLVGGLAGYGEVAVGGSGLASRLSLSLGVSYTFGDR